MQQEHTFVYTLQHYHSFSYYHFRVSDSWGRLLQNQIQLEYLLVLRETFKGRIYFLPSCGGEIERRNRWWEELGLQLWRSEREKKLQKKIHDFSLVRINGREDRYQRTIKSEGSKTITDQQCTDREKYIIKLLKKQIKVSPLAKISVCHLKLV